MPHTTPLTAVSPFLVVFWRGLLGVVFISIYIERVWAGGVGLSCGSPWSELHLQVGLVSVPYSEGQGDLVDCPWDPGGGVFSRVPLCGGIALCLDFEKMSVWKQGY